MTSRPQSHLNPEKALIFRITHRDNLPWILDHGLHCRKSPEQDENFVSIGLADVISRRESRPVPVGPGGTLADYVPFYFTPFSPMLMKIVTGHGNVVRRSRDEILVLVTSLRDLAEASHKFVVCDRNASLRAAHFVEGLDGLSLVDFPLLESRDFSRNPDDPERSERYQAEALIHRHLPVGSLRGLVCYGEPSAVTAQNEIQRRELSLPVHTRPSWFFE